MACRSRLFIVVARQLLGKSGRFKMEGRFLHLNQGQVLVYSPDGGIDGLDTINIQGGRFVYETEMRDPSTLVLVFPNYSEQPIFAEPGGKVMVKADASHLREMEVEGTDDNELMTDFPAVAGQKLPLGRPEAHGRLVKEHPGSRVGVYLVSTYLVRNDRPDYAEARRLINLMRKEQPRNGHLVLLAKQLAPYETVRIGQPLPRFKPSPSAAGRHAAKLPQWRGVVIVWASWSYRSLGCLRAVQEAKAPASRPAGTDHLSRCDAQGLREVATPV
mgnify:CR=1 FL=1